MKSVEYFNKGTGERLYGYYFLDEQGSWWECEFGSCDSASSPNNMWAGTASKLDFEVAVRMTENHQGTILANN